MWDEWIYVPGLAPGDLDFSTQALEDSINLAEEYILLGGTDSPENFLDYNGYLYSQKLAFVQTISNSDDVDASLLAVIDEDLDLSLSETNPFVKTEWYVAGIRNFYDPVMDPAYVWLGEQGRHAFVTPTFRALVNDANDCETATAWYDDYIATYNSYVQGRVNGVMEACTGETTPPEEEGPTAAPTEEGTDGGTTPEEPDPSNAYRLDYSRVYGALSLVMFVATIFSL